MGEPPRPVLRLPTLSEAIRARRWVTIEAELGTEAADRDVGNDLWVATNADGGLLVASIHLEEALRRLSLVEGYITCEEGLEPDRAKPRPPTQYEADLLSMIRRGRWANNV